MFYNQDEAEEIKEAEEVLKEETAEPLQSEPATE